MTPSYEDMYRLLWELAYSGRRSFLTKLDDVRLLLSGNTHEQPEEPPPIPDPEHNREPDFPYQVNVTKADGGEEIMAGFMIETDAALWADMITDDPEFEKAVIV